MPQDEKYLKEIGIHPPSNWMEFCHRHFFGMCLTVIICVALVAEIWK